MSKTGHELITAERWWWQMGCVLLSSLLFYMFGNSHNKKLKMCWTCGVGRTQPEWKEYRLEITGRSLPTSPTVCSSSWPALHAVPLQPRPCHLPWLPPTPTATYPNCHLPWLPPTPTAIYPDSHLPWLPSTLTACLAEMVRGEEDLGTDPYLSPSLWPNLHRTPPFPFSRVIGMLQQQGDSPQGLDSWENQICPTMS